ncbi:hypothetical protein [Mycobacterium intracellulare]|uniref:hypothetical protein n=1 Tax=Mycobacterium intracellulare TaxID=1767 RepID=UPI000AC3F31D|nr:hypothetical protein [Mycobacterium intracellulare]
MSPKQVKLFLVDSTRSGLTTAEIINRIRDVLSVVAPDLAKLDNPDEVQQTVGMSAMGRRAL